MFKLDDNLLQELGLGGLPPADKNSMLGHIYETLELRVGMRLAEQMSDSQLNEFEGFVNGDVNVARGYLDGGFAGWEQAQDYLQQRSQAEQAGRPGDSIIPEYAALRWLETNFPDYKNVVADELEKLKGEIKAQAPQIVATAHEAAQQAAGAAPVAGQQPTMPAQSPTQPAPDYSSPDPAVPSQPAVDPSSVPVTPAQQPLPAQPPPQPQQPPSYPPPTGDDNQPV